MSEPNASELIIANDFIDLRLNHFKKLALRVKALVLEIVQYYLGSVHAFDLDAAVICNAIEACKKTKDEAEMVDCYRQFLNFLPVRLKVSLQQNLFRQPTAEEMADYHFYNNDLERMLEYNALFFKEDGMGMSEYKKLLLKIHGNAPQGAETPELNL